MTPETHEILKYAIDFHKKGDFDNAVAAYKLIISNEPRNHVANHNLGLIKFQLGQVQEASELFLVALEELPTNPQYWISGIDVNIQLGFLDKAETLFDTAIKIGASGTDFDALRAEIKATKNVVKKYHDGQLNLTAKSKKIYDAKYSKNFIIQSYFGISNYVNGRLSEAVKNFSNALSVRSDAASVYNYLGQISKIQGDIEQAENLFRKGIRLNPNDTSLLNSLGLLLKEKFSNSEAILIFKKALEIKPEYAPLHNNLGNTYRNLGELNNAVKSYRLAISNDPTLAEAHNGLGNVFTLMGNIEDGIKSYKEAMALKDNYSLAQAQYIYHKMNLCDWSGLSAEFENLDSLGISNEAVPPFALLAAEDNPKNELLRTKNWVAQHYSASNYIFKINDRSKFPRKLRIGYFSSDFKAHPVSHLILGVIENHDREKFEVHGYSLSWNENDPIKNQLIRNFDHFHEMFNEPDSSVVQKVRNEGIDIAIDLTGYTRSSRSKIFSHRLAPVQINYLGFPGSMGADYMDYIIADKFLIPPGFEKFYSEKIVFLPHCYQAQDDSVRIKEPKISKNDLGINEDTFLFCALNNAYKIDEGVFDVWMAILRQTANSAIWLLENNPKTKSNLRREAKSRGIKADRLIFSKRVEYSDYIASLQLANLFLDTFNYNAGATASNVLYAGLPILTKSGKSYSSRMAGSLLNALELSELICETEKEYIDRAINFYENPLSLSNVKLKLEAQKSSSPLFNTKEFTKNLETAYYEVYKRFADGLRSKHITIRTK